MNNTIEKLLEKNILHPTKSEQKVILEIIRTLSMDEIEELVVELVNKGIIFSQIYDKDNNKRKKERYELYIKSIDKVCRPYFRKFTKDDVVCDVGCGDGQITLALFGEFIKKGGKVYGCDVVDYLCQEAKDKIKFQKTDGLNFFKNFTDNFFSCVTEIVTLHHLPTLQLYREYIKEMIRITKQKGIVVFVETTHSTWNEELTNAVLDILLNDRTSRQITKSTKRAIPVPVQFLSEEEIEKEIVKNNAVILKKAVMKKTIADPKKHIIYICMKN